MFGRMGVAWWEALFGFVARSLASAHVYFERIGAKTRSREEEKERDKRIRNIVMYWVGKEAPATFLSLEPFGFKESAA